jgi:hypothetical protein
VEVINPNQNMKNIERLLHQQSEQLAHLQGRLDIAQSTLNVIAAFVATLVALPEPEQYKSEGFAKRLKAHMDVYVKSQQQGVAQLSEFPFVPNPQPDKEDPSDA